MEFILDAIVIVLALAAVAKPRTQAVAVTPSVPAQEVLERLADELEAEVVIKPAEPVVVIIEEVVEVEVAGREPVQRSTATAYTKRQLEEEIRRWNRCNPEERITNYKKLGKAGMHSALQEVGAIV